MRNKHLLPTLVFVLVAGMTLAGYSNIRAQSQATLVETAKAVVDKLAAEDFCAVSERFDSNLKRSLKTDSMQEAWAAFIAQTGAFKRHLSAETGKSPEGYELVHVKCDFEKSPGIIRVVFDVQKRIIGLWFKPEGTSAAVTIGEPELAQGNSPDAVSAAANRVLDLPVYENLSPGQELFNAQRKGGSY